ncbi:Acyl-CoA thioesterase YbgC [Ferriphaselus amnicola]|uniref:Acyl-CoA thioesterase YbgC n=1 Tax=Ferriphaselus amnicola TaxID=1188319 RepID=A0A2Z6GB76_9PROT|nr:tol-pal system-associated acyl-CoA thioesterase [Ferriphaselus amnicola]BBE50629.1 Acyl-CoA thioesterase YbgC [Ferriphaselus amnicola]
MTDTQPYSLPVRVYFHDTDAGGVVYHANYANFMERARTEWLRDVYGYNHAAMMKELGVAFVVCSMKLDFLRPAVLDDLLQVTAELKEIGRSRVTIHQSVKRGSETLTTAEIHLVCVDISAFRPVAVPDVLRNQWKD